MANQSSLPSEFKLRRYFAKYEFKVRHLLSCSAAEAVTQAQLLSKANTNEKKAWDSLHLGYTESNGHPELLSAIGAAFYPSLDPHSDILCCVPREGINIAFTCLISLLTKRQGEPFHAIATFPAHQILYEWLRCRQVPLSFWTADASDPERWSFDVDVLKGLVRPSTRLLVVNFPHNPTGFAPTPEAWESLLQWCHERSIIVFSDEIYRYLVPDPNAAPLRPACEVTKSAVSLCALSKCFGMPGLRSGWLATQNTRLLTAFRYYKDYVTFCGSAPSEILSTIVLKQHRFFLERAVKILRANLKAVDVFVGERAHLVAWRRPDAGPLALLELRPPLLARFGSGTQLSQALRASTGVVLLPAAMMGCEDKFVRIGLGRENFHDVLAIFAKFIDASDGPDM